MKILNRKEAIRTNSKKYFTGIHCKHGHIAKRTTSNGTCIECSNIRSNKHYHTNNSYRIAQINRSKEQFKKFGSMWHHNNKEHCSDLNKSWIRRNKKHNQKKMTEWRSKNLSRLTFLQSRRRSQKIKATPKWANHSIIQDMYSKADQLTNATSIQYVVDHIVPLNNPLVCGLHCETNLQIITLIENSSKGNRYWPGMP